MQNCDHQILRVESVEYANGRQGSLSTPFMLYGGKFEEPAGTTLTQLPYLLPY